MELKEFRFADPDHSDIQYRYAVLHMDEYADMDFEKYIVNADDSVGTAIYPGEIDYWIEILSWIKEHQGGVVRSGEAKKAIDAGDAERVIDPRTLLDSAGVTEEDG